MKLRSQIFTPGLYLPWRSTRSPSPAAPSTRKRDPRSQRPARLARFHHRRFRTSPGLRLCTQPTTCPQASRRGRVLWPTDEQRPSPMHHAQDSVRPPWRPDADVGHTLRSAVRRWESLHERGCMLQSEILTALMEGEVPIWVQQIQERAI
ncbi:hypothetical protein BD310DRAFT_930332 [Dichomitus squalens]|uniref:Uncharacterized protein n=1 Tax=Dichomitus squalens TaxID=114155 RepID=A0A4Q9PRC9_9APHY|nr:hypothetical protein BD310DRAFT_930332 [Dichomitus squalens]